MDEIKNGGPAFPQTMRHSPDGKEAQFYSAGVGHVGLWWPASFGINPLSRPELEWRIKPEPKPDSVHISRIALRPTGNGLQTALVNLFDTDGGKVQYTFDGETGKLKSAEVLP